MDRFQPGEAVGYRRSTCIRDSEYAQSLRYSLLSDGTHRVYVVDQPDMRIDRDVVIDGNQLHNLAPCVEQPERFVDAAEDVVLLAHVHYAFRGL